MPTPRTAAWRATTRRAAWLLAAALLAACAPHNEDTTERASPPAAASPKTLRFAFAIAETGFDPAQVSDIYSRTVVANIFESPLTYDYLARPAKIVPLTAAAMPEASADSRQWTIRLAPGTYFADDPAFGGKRRELVAADYAYSIRRIYDPALASPSLSQLETAGVAGLAALRREALAGKPFDYDRPVAGLQLLDRYTLRITLERPAPRFATVLADSALLGAVAREVAQHYGSTIMQHPVGTGPYRLTQWRRSSLIVLEKNPGFRQQHYSAEPAPGDAQGQAILARMRGKRLPLIDRVEISIVEESQPRLLAFLNAQHDLLDRLPPELAPSAIPHNVVAPNLAARGIRLERLAAADVSYAYFGMEDPVVGGYTPEKVALRRALALAYDVHAEIDRVRNGQGIPAQSLLPPGVAGYDPSLNTGMAEVDLARAQALLDVYGYVDTDGDGWRDLPGGAPLAITYASQPDQASRGLQELWRKAGDALQVRIRFEVAKWPEQLKASRAGRLQMWGLAWSATTPDASYMLGLLYGRSKGQSNHARFDLPAYNALFEQQDVLPDGPERDALMRRMAAIATAYMPMKLTNHRVLNDLLHPWVIGYRRHPFMREHLRYLDIDVAGQRVGRAEAS